MKKQAVKHAKRVTYHQLNDILEDISIRLARIEEMAKESEAKTRAIHRAFSYLMKRRWAEVEGIDVSEIQTILEVP